MPFAATWMDIEIVILSEVNQTEKDKYCDFNHMQNLKQTNPKPTHKQNKTKTNSQIQGPD